MQEYDLIVIGTGPGGYHAAIRAGQLGLKTLAIERAEVGGVCLNEGCIPTKALLHAVKVRKLLKKASEFGLTAKEEAFDLKKLAAWRDRVAKKLSKGVEFLFRENGVELVRGEAKVLSPREVEVAGERYRAKRLVLATGSRPVELSGFPFDEEKVLSSKGALLVEKGIPKRLLVLGGGAVGLELASVYHGLGAKVTLVELKDQILPGADPEATDLLTRTLRRQGIDIKTGTKALGFAEGEEGLLVKLAGPKGEEELVFDKILVAVGRRPNSEGLAELGLSLNEGGFVITDERMQTSVPGVYAIGDLRGAPLLAHKAMKEGVVAAEAAAGMPSAFDQQIPLVVYTDPEFASVGLTEAEAKERGIPVKVGRFPYSASGRAQTLQEREGFVKVVADAEYRVVLGVQIVGPEASELIAEAALAVEMGALADDLELTIHPHPTLSESLMEAAANLMGAAIHIPNK